MKIFGKTLSEYIAFQKVFLILIVIVGLARLGLSLGGVEAGIARWFSISVVGLVGFVYYAVRVYPSGFGSYKHLLPLLVIQNVIAHGIIIGGIVIAILTGKDNIFSLPEYSGGSDGKTWLHVGAHVLFGMIAASLVFWLIGSLILWVTKKLTGSKPAPAAAA